MPTFKEIQDFVEDELQEIQAQPDYNVTRLKAYINRGQQDFVRRTKCLSKVYAITSVADQVSYTLNNAIYHIKHVRYVTDSATEIGEHLRPYPGGYDKLPKIIQTGTPDWYWVRYAHTYGTGEIGTWPIMDTGSETLNVFAYFFPADLSANADQSDIKEAWHEAMVHYAVWKFCNIYSHLSAAIRQKAIDNKAYYEQLVSDAQEAFLIDLDDGYQLIVDEYEGL